MTLSDAIHTTDFLDNHNPTLHSATASASRHLVLTMLLLQKHDAGAYDGTDSHEIYRKITAPTLNC